MNVDVCPVGVLRSAGLPLSWVRELRDDEAAVAVDAAGDARALTPARAAVQRGDARMREIAARPLFALAVDAANPELHDTALLPYAGGARNRVRPRRRVLAALLQRFATKNDTAAGFGPVDRVELGGAEPLHQPPTTTGRWAERRGFLSWWAVQALADAIVRDESAGEAGTWRLHSLARIEGGALRLGDRSVRLPPEAEQAVAAISSGRWRGQPPPALVRAGLVRRSLLVPPSQPDPAAWLVGVLEGARSDRLAWWRERLQGLRAAADAVSRGAPGTRRAALRALEHELSALTGRDIGARGHGRFYADRQVVYEEARAAEAAYQVGGALRVAVADDVGALARLAALYGYARHRQARAWLRERLGGQPVPLTAVAALLSDEPPALLDAEAGGDAATVREALAKLAQAGDGVISSGALDCALAHVPAPRLALSSPDVMLDASSPGLPGRVLGEHHAGLQVFGIAQVFSDEAPLHRWLEAALPLSLDGLAQVVAPRAQGKAYLQELPGAWSVEFGAAALSDRRAPFGAVRVCWEGEAPVLELAGGARATLLPLDLANPLYRVLSPHATALPALRDGRHTTEVRLGEAVLQRERWDVPVPGEVPGGCAERFVAARRLRAAWGLPEEAFVRVASQPKPFYVDFRSPVLTDVLWRWLRAASEITVSRMLPSGDGLWLRRGQDAFCSELRLSAVVTGQDDGG